MTQKLFSIAYFPPIDYLLEMKTADTVLVEAHENYQKQSYRNRATILTGNGLHDLIIPIVRNSEKQIKEIRIDYSMAWQRNHWKTIESAYNNSPYFLYYRDFFEPLFQKTVQKSLCNTKNKGYCYMPIQWFSNDCAAKPRYYQCVSL